MLYQWRVENQSMCLLLGTAGILLFQGDCGRFFTMSLSSWLREKGHYLVDNITYKETYIPSRVTWGESCHCGFCKSSMEKCHYCSHPYRKVIENSILAGKVLADKNLVDKTK